jgi:hypothetical protein
VCSLHGLALFHEVVNALSSVRRRSRPSKFGVRERLQHVAQRDHRDDDDCHVDVSRSHPAVSLQIFHKHTSHLRVDLLQISGYKLSSPWGIGVFDLCPGQIFSQEGAIASSCSARLAPPVAHAEATKSDYRKRMRLRLSILRFAICVLDDLTLQGLIALKGQFPRARL